MAIPFIIIQLDKPRRLRFGIQALAIIASDLNISLQQLVKDSLTPEKIRADELLRILWAGLLEDDESLTPASVGKLVDDYSDIVVVINVVAEALNNAFQSAEKNQMGEMENGTGKQ